MIDSSDYDDNLDKMDAFYRRFHAADLGVLELSTLRDSNVVDLCTMNYLIFAATLLTLVGADVPPVESLGSAPKLFLEGKDEFPPQQQILPVALVMALSKLLWT